MTQSKIITAFVFLILCSFSAAFSQNNLLKSNFLSFRAPSIDRTIGSRDSNVYERMQYYGFWSGAPMVYFDGFLRNHESQLNSAGILLYDQYVTAALNDYKTWMGNNKNYFPPVSDRFRHRMNKKMLLSYNTNYTYCLLVDSCMSNIPSASKKTKAMEVIAKSIATTDSLFRGWYGCDSIYHQICEELQFQWKDGKLNHDFSKYVQYDSVAGYRLFFSVMDSISLLAKQRMRDSTTSKTAVEWGWGRNQFYTTDPTNTAQFRIDLYHMLMNVNYIVMIVNYDNLQGDLIGSNAVGDSISRNGRKLAARVTWWGDTLSVNQSSSSFYESLQDATNYLTNAQFLSVFPGDYLDGSVRIWNSSVNQYFFFNKDASQCFTALSKWLNKNYLPVIDKFSEAYVDTAWWNTSGTITASGADSIITISSSASIQSKPHFGSSTTRAVIKRNGDANATQELGIFSGSGGSPSRSVYLFVKNDTAYTRAKVDDNPPVVTKYTAFGRINPATKHELKIERSKYYADFYIDGSYLGEATMYNGDGDFDSQLLIYTTSGSSSMIVDSTSVIDESAATVEITLTGSQVTGTRNTATAAASFNCSKAARVQGYLYRNGVKAPSAFYDSYTNVTSGSASTVVTVAYPQGPATYNIGFIANYGSGADSVKANSFTICRDSTILASAGEEEEAASLPRAFSLTQNAPNPFNPSTTISYSIPSGVSSINVSLEVFNVRGQRVATLIDNEAKGPGTYSVAWNGTKSDGRRAASGVYFYRLRAGNYAVTRKMAIVK
ncbi:T9SS type A sorting domain-containing protein [bacterium]|nr:T9SS type A sorting domain-containing protein [bacterium]